MSTSSSSSSLEDESGDREVKDSKTRVKKKKKTKYVNAKVEGKSKTEPDKDKKEASSSEKFKEDVRSDKFKGHIKVNDGKNKPENEKVNVKDNMGVSGSDGKRVRQQLKAKVSVSLEKRGVSTKDRWSTRPKTGQLNPEEQRRLDKQRYNKRKWAAKERARIKTEIESLRNKNGQLEYTNQMLRRNVDMLIQCQLKLRSHVIDHTCKWEFTSRSGLKREHTSRPGLKWENNSPSSSGSARVLKIPTHNGSKLLTTGGKGEDTKTLNGAERASQSRICRLSSIGEEEEPKPQVIPGLVRIKGTDIILKNGVIYRIDKGGLRPIYKTQPVYHECTPDQTKLSVTSATASSAEKYTPYPATIATTSNGYSDITPNPAKQIQIINEEDIEDDVVGENIHSGMPFCAPPTPAVTSSSSTNLYSGGFIYNELNSNKTFLQMLQEGDDNADDVIMVDETTDESEFVVPEIKTEPIDTSETDVANSMLPESVQAIQTEAELEAGGYMNISNSIASRDANFADHSTIAKSMSGDMTSILEKYTSYPSDRLSHKSGGSGATIHTNSDSKALKKRTKHGVLMDKWRADEERRLKSQEAHSPIKETDSEFRRVTRSASAQHIEDALYEALESPTDDGQKRKRSASSVTATPSREGTDSDGFKTPKTTSKKARKKAAKRLASWPKGQNEEEEAGANLQRTPQFVRSASLPTTIADVNLPLDESENFVVALPEEPEMVQRHQYEEVETEIVDSDFIAEALDEAGVVPMDIMSSAEDQAAAAVIKYSTVVMTYATSTEMTPHSHQMDTATYGSNLAGTAYYSNAAEMTTYQNPVEMASCNNPAEVVSYNNPTQLTSYAYSAAAATPSSLISPENLPGSPTSPTSPVPRLPFQIKSDIGYGQEIIANGQEQDLQRTEPEKPVRVVAQEGLGSRQAWEILCEVSSDVLHGELQAELQSQG